MNFCMKCQSLYSQPGTCNCFAGTQPAFVPTLPIYPQPTITPTYLGISPIWIAPYWHGSWGTGSTDNKFSITTSTPENVPQSCNMTGCRGDCGIC